MCVNVDILGDVTLTITKVKEDGEALAGAKFAVFKDGVKVGSDSAETTVADNTVTITLTAPAAGEYVLREIQTPDGYTTHADLPFTITQTPTGDYQYNPSTGHYEKTYTAAVSGTDFVNGAVTVTNVHEKGTLTIEKWIHIDDKNKIPDETVIFYGSGDNEKVTFAKDEFEWNEDGYYVASEQIFGLNTGSYTISENRTEVPGYDGKTGINGGTLSSNKTVSGTVQLGTDGTTVKVENHYERTTHELTVRKNVDWTSESQAPDARDKLGIQVTIP